ncbi:unnamed protein product [marine sediment metagenome]|uniref:Uncharacterized protein n=1 Tax=marine sediment metagenome TaxID=412755 RepID=X0ULA5_9ZZZZ
MAGEVYQDVNFVSCNLINKFSIVDITDVSVMVELFFEAFGYLVLKLDAGISIKLDGRTVVSVEERFEEICDGVSSEMW